MYLKKPTLLCLGRGIISDDYKYLKGSYHMPSRYRSYFAHLFTEAIIKQQLCAGVNSQ